MQVLKIQSIGLNQIMILLESKIYKDGEIFHLKSGCNGNCVSPSKTQ